MKKRILSLLLSLVLLVSLVGPGTIAYADDSDDSGMEISKTAVDNHNGTYTITLEAYATGSTIISQVTKDVPTDIILVLDQSGSMEEGMGTVTKFAERENASNETLFKYRNNGGDNDLWHKLNDGSYVSVSVTKTEKMVYSKLSSSMVNYKTTGYGPFSSVSSDCYYYYMYNLYEKVDDEYKKVNLEYTWNGNPRVYKYTFSDGTTVTSRRNSDTPNLGSHAPLYTVAKDDTQTVYTYQYTDANGDLITIGTSTGANAVFSPALYSSYTTSSGSRLSAIQTAVTNFANAVTEKAKGLDGEYGTADDINHRIAVVGFAQNEDYFYGGDRYEDIPAYTNTEVFVGSDQYQYGTSASAQYGNAFQDMNTQAGYDNIIASKNALDANGGTYTNLGIQMANGIFNANPIPTGTVRNRVVIVFTDGIPGKSGYDPGVAGSAITEANTAKNTYGATVYSIGIFNGADATKAGSLNTNDNADKGNYFLQRVSSNTQYPQSPSYYLSAGDAESLNDIFQQISNNIETGGTHSTLTEESVVRDIISPQFTLPKGADASHIRLETYRCTGKEGDKYTWSKNDDAMGATANVEGDKVNVTGFNFSQNYVGTVTENGNVSYRGHKLVIKFDVVPKDGMLGGNAIQTNTRAGIYENASSTTPVREFEKPTVNVKIPEVDVKVKDKDVYLKGEVTADELKSGAVIEAGNSVTLDLSKENYGLESWQNEYVNINVKITDKNNKDVTDKIADLTDDSTYNVIVTISPKYKGPVTAESGTGTANINVFKPELTYKDSSAYYGETAATEFTDNKYSEIWKHGDTKDIDDGVIMLGTKPKLTLSYEPKSGTIVDGKYTKKDVPVKVKVEIGTEDVTAKTTFKHQDCTDTECKWSNPDTPGDPAFMIHIKTCKLTVKKSGGADNEPYVFTVYKDGKKYSEVTVKNNRSETISELPVGTYTIKEDEGWSWRYRANNGNAVTLQATSPTGEIECTNTKEIDQWLNGFSDVVTNIFGKPHTQKGGKN